MQPPQQVRACRRGVQKNKAAGGILTAKQAPHRPGILSALGLRAGGIAARNVGQATLNGDGRLDVAAAQTDGNNVTVLMGDGDGNLQAGRDFDVGFYPRSVAVGDISGDGRLDLVTANQWSESVSVLLNDGNDANGNATFEPARDTGVNGEAESVAVGDFNADGRLDLAVSSYDSWYYYSYYGSNSGALGYVSVLLGNGDGSFATASATAITDTRLGEVAAADFNGDDHLDVVTHDGFQTGSVDPTVLLGRGDGTFDPPFYFDAGSGPIAPW